MIARVQPLTLTRSLRGTFDYRLRADQQEVDVGSVLRVPFNSRRTVAVVVALAEGSELPLDRLAEPEEVLSARLPSDLVELAGWMAREYCSTPARALSLMLGPSPDRIGPREVLVASLTAAGRAELTEADGAAPAGVRPLTAAQRALLERLDLAGEAPAAELGTASLRRLETRGLVRMRMGAVRGRRARRRYAVASSRAVAPELNPDQRAALDRVLDVLGHADRQGHRPRFLLHGVTGSGKTEVYLGAVEAALATGHGAIVLVPEIALTPQALERFHARLGDTVAVLHSGLTRRQRFEEWQRLLDGEARVCVGARSAIFAPVSDIGLIVIDEEHEGSYKHEGDPRYDARRVAERRSEQHAAVLLLGSATPRAESVIGPTRLRLPRRVDGRPLPPVEILDMRGHHHALHPQTRLALSDLQREGGKAIVLLNRRGWSNFLTCRSCGKVWMCPNCEVALVLHRAAGYLACHHCGHRQSAPTRCPDCRSTAVARHGAGTEALEHELATALADERFPVLRLDADATELGERARILAAFAAAPAGLLLGTQMVAKGHDFPDVALGVVLDADRTLRFPDFRAEERTFALVTQLAGRAGRGIGGRVLVQTLAPEARSIRFAAAHDADGFLDDELLRRRALTYPPFSTLIRVVCAAEEASEASAAAAELRCTLSPPDSIVLGPAPLFRLRGRARSQLVIKGGDRQGAIDAIGAAVDRLAKPAADRGVSLSVDVDPQ